MQADYLAARKTLIKPHELGGWVNAVLSLPVGDRDYFMVLPLTGLRRNEAMELQWSNVDLTGRALTIRDPKNHNDHTLPLSDYLVDLFTRRKAAAMALFVFADEAGRRVSHLRYARDRIEKATGVRFTPHDLRRTLATIAESIDIPAYLRAEATAEPRRRCRRDRWLLGSHPGTTARSHAANR